MSRLKEIQNLIDDANQKYYTCGNAILEDAKYDLLKLELQKLNPTDPRLFTVGATVRDTILQKKAHSIPMGSLNKALNRQEFEDWYRNTFGKIDKSIIFHASFKMDGGSYSLEYKNGKLVSAISRGDGITGEDILANALKFKNLPNNGNNNLTGHIRGEAILSIDDWKIVDPEQTSNPRNQAVGIARRKDGMEAEYLSFFAFRMFDADGSISYLTESDMTSALAGFGFDVAPSIIGDFEAVWQWYLEIQTKRSTLPYWIDGIVLKINSIKSQMALGESSGCPKGQVALKFDAEGAVSTLLRVTFQVGNTGALCPVATFFPVRIGGTTISNASLCNMEIIEALDVCIGDKISVIKAGDIIPRIMDVVEKGNNRIAIKAPTECPCCTGRVGYKSNVNGEASSTIYCLNKDCPAVIVGKIDKYLKSLDIQGIGTSVIESLVKELGIKTPADLYILHKKEPLIADMMLNDKVRMGEKRASKILDEIDKKRNLTISELLGSLSIFGLGKRRVALIQENTGGKLDVLDPWFDGILTKYAVEAGIPNIADRIEKELIELKPYIYSFLKNGVTIVKPKPKVTSANAFTICITGTLSKSKKYYQTKIESAGHNYTDTFAKDITYLVAVDVNSGSAKLTKAVKYGIKVISEKELEALI